MASNDTSAPTQTEAARPVRRKAPARRRAAAGKKSLPRKKPVSRTPPRGAGALETLLDGLSRRAARTGRRIAAISEEGISGARRSLGRAGAASKKTIDRLTREWKAMDTAKRARFVAALLGALAAASAPIVGRRLKKK